MKKYLFNSTRLGFRSWNEEDVDLLFPISSDAEVMEFFPSIQSREYVTEFIGRMQNEYAEKGHCYYAVEKLEDGEFIGFIGLHEQTFESEFTPCIDIGWRLKKAVWNKGFATEGAKRCLEYAFEDLNFQKVYSIASKVNQKSIRIMEKIGMEWEKDFVFPPLDNDERLRLCSLYSMNKK
jgi:RimJ/RimL family protein N-acetyltransferase